MLEPWGLTPKSATDSETIEQAIARLITAHENDPTAHLGTGESLEAHKSADIIDHPASSVIGDKFDAQGSFLTTSFESLSNFNITGDVSQEGWPGVNFGWLEQSPYKALLDNIASNGRYFIDFTKSFSVQFSFNLSSNGAGLTYFRFGQITENPSPLLSKGVALELLPTGDLFRWKRTDHDITVSLATITRDVNHTARIMFDVDLDTLYLFIDGVQVASMPNTWPASNVGGPNYMIYLDNTTADGNGDRSFLSVQYLTINCR